HVGLLADDADEVLHDVLQLGLDRVRVLAVGARQGGQRLLGDRLELSVVDGEPAAKVLGIERGGLAGPAPEDEEVGEGGAAAVAAMARQTRPCGGPRPALASELMARATSSRGRRSGVRRLFFLSAYQRSASASLSAVSPLKNSGM